MFFFFKQKTAYELRISDWSSDVCSSDLPDAHHPSDPALTNRQLMIRGNLIQGVGRDYSDNAAVLATYWDGSVIIHTDISDATVPGIHSASAGAYLSRAAIPTTRPANAPRTTAANPSGSPRTTHAPPPPPSHTSPR